MTYDPEMKPQQLTFRVLDLDPALLRITRHVAREYVDDSDDWPWQRTYLLVELTNVSNDVLDLQAGHHTWATYDAAGNEISVDLCDGSFPGRIAPGARAYISASYDYDVVLDDGPAPSASVAEISVRPLRSTEPPTATGRVQGLQVGGIPESRSITRATGTAINTTREPWHDATVMVVLFDAHGELLGALWDYGLGRLAPGMQVAFTLHESLGVDPHEIARTEAICFDFTWETNARPTFMA